ncbi:MAG: outer membrane beta-barrel protein [Deltaproteobacteria bacterium]|nr:outer membrane beta-barrel protein [Deltaproteobacteria bacterium]
MKKLIITGVVAAMAFSSVAQAELEISGNITTGMAYQHDDKDAANTVAGAIGAGGVTQGDLSWAPTANADHFGWFVDQVELDVESEFGENIRARADLDFYDLGTPSTVRGGADAFFLEQAYVTANIAVGNGMEFLVGKFNAPVGLESVDRYENVFSTYTPGWLFLTPKQVMGAKIYYDFNDNWNFDLAVVNSLNNSLTGNSAYPSGLLRVGANWGDEGRESFWHMALGFGPEHNTAAGQTSQNTHFDMLGSTWGNFAFGDYWDLGWEATYRQTNTLNGGANQKALAGQLYVAYQASDVWSVQARGAAFWEINPAGARGGSGASTTGGTWSGFEGVTYSGSLAATYEITEDADLLLEYRFDYASTAGAALNADFHTGVAQFAYSF